MSAMFTWSLLLPATYSSRLFQSLLSHEISKPYLLLLALNSLASLPGS
jgi:hypothetical protein